MHSKTLMTLNVLNDLRHAASDALKAEHKLPALLLLYSFIDICASLSDEKPASGTTNRARFETYLARYALCSWSVFSTRELWSARSSLLHAYSPFGTHTKLPSAVRPLFYFAWPEKRDEVMDELTRRGYKGFVLADVKHIEGIATSAFNGLFIRMADEPMFEQQVHENAEHLLKDLSHYKLETELALVDELRKLADTGEKFTARRF